LLHLTFILINYIIYDENNQVADVIICENLKLFSKRTTNTNKNALKLFEKNIENRLFFCGKPGKDRKKDSKKRA